MDRWTRIALRRQIHYRPSGAEHRLERRQIVAGGRRIHLRECGDRDNRRSMVLVHGLAVSSLYMTPLMVRLADHYRVLAPDLPGFGYTDGPWRGITIEELADALGAVIESAGLDRPVLLGNSMGCQIIADLAMRRPDLVRGVVLQGPTMDPFARFAPYQMGRWLLTSAFEPTSLGLILLHDYLLCGSRRIIGTFRHALRDPIEEKLPRLDVPGMVVRGSDDFVVSEEWARRAAELMEPGWLREIPGVAHTVNYDAPLELSRVVEPFVRALFDEQQYSGPPVRR